jgi:hypothetical protein
MSKNMFILARILFVFIIIIIGHYVIVAQVSLTGDWKADARSEKRPDKIYVSFERRTDKGGNSQTGETYDYSDFQGLSADRALNGGPVKFSMAREAGTIECEGKFTDGKGSGSFRFTSNPNFVSAMKSRGFDFEKNTTTHGPKEVAERLFAATTLNVTTAFADDLLSANFGALDVEDLFKARIFNITPQFMSEMKASGFPNMGMEDLVKARIFKIDADFVRQVAGMGFIGEPFESLVKMRIFKITPEFISEVQNEGMRDVGVEQLVKMRIFNIDSAFIRKAKSENPNVTVEDMVQMKIGVKRGE